MVNEVRWLEPTSQSCEQNVERELALLIAQKAA
jgi:hypothetical protein